MLLGSHRNAPTQSFPNTPQAWPEPGPSPRTRARAPAARARATVGARAGPGSWAQVATPLPPDAMGLSTFGFPHRCFIKWGSPFRKMGGPFRKMDRSFRKMKPHFVKWTPHFVKWKTHFVKCSKLRFPTQNQHLADRNDFIKWCVARRRATQVLCCARPCNAGSVLRATVQHRLCVASGPVYRMRDLDRGGGEVPQPGPRAWEARLRPWPRPRARACALGLGLGPVPGSAQGVVGMARGGNIFMTLCRLARAPWQPGPCGCKELSQTLS